jgi:hypothetical protein
VTFGRYVLTADVTIAWPATWSEVIQGAANIPIATPAMPATTVPVSNPYGVAAAITIAASGATITAISTGSNSANLSATALTSGTVFLPNDWAISVTYSGGTPTWTWLSAQLPQSGASSQVAAVSNPAPPGGQLGTIMQTTFLQGSPLWLDTAGSLYTAIGSGNLRAWIDGTDNVGHGHWACLGNLGRVP